MYLKVYCLFFKGEDFYEVTHIITTLIAGISHFFPSLDNSSAILTSPLIVFAQTLPHTLLFSGWLRAF